MNTKQLRQKILDMAIKGKLVPQDPNDEPACKLLERIREEKEQLIKEGKLKRDKNESYIFVGADKLHYEKFADGSVVCIEDEIPFEIPENWAWARLKDIANYGRMQSLTYKQIQDKNLWILDLEDIEKETSKLIIRNRINNKMFSSSKKKFVKNDVLYGKLRPYLDKVLIADEDGICTTEIVPIRIYKDILPEYLRYILKSPFFLYYVNNLTYGVKMPRLGTDDAENALLPIPPLSEQKKIVNILNSTINAIENITLDKEALANVMKQTKAKVLDLAIKGKLVPQDPNDEPADKLLEKIREEKEKLIKEGKLKRDKNESYIYKNSDDNSYYEQIDGETVCIDDDLPFEIPDSWRWTKFANICEIARGGSPRPIEAYLTNAENGINWIKIGDTEKGGKYIYSTKEKIKPEGISKSRYVKAGDFLLTNSMSFGRPYILKTDGCIHDGWLVINDDFKVFDQNFLYYLLSSNVMYQLLSIAAQGSTVKNLKSDTVKNVIIPIPPKREQSQIASRIASIFSQLDTMQEIFLQ